jgi:polyphosphate kinase
MRRYCHLGTGNYNPTTARIYTDLGLLSAHEGIGKDVADMFNMITGYAKAPALDHLAVAPYALRRRLMDLIARETSNAQDGRPARIRAKMNSLVDSAVVRALYEASRAGVVVELCVRGICCLKPGVPGMSDNISVVSVVGRFLEHSRIFWFQNDGGEPEVFISSADWMPRNLDRRVEQMVPILDPEIRARVTEILENSLRDNVKGREILPDGSYRSRRPAPDEDGFHSQEVMRAQAMQRTADTEDADESADEDAA